MSGDHNRYQKPVKSYCGGKPNYVEVGQVVQAFGDLTAVEIPNMPPVGTKLYVAADDMSEKRVQILTENEQIDEHPVDRWCDCPDCKSYFAEPEVGDGFYYAKKGEPK